MTDASAHASLPPRRPRPRPRARASLLGAFLCLVTVLGACPPSSRAAVTPEQQKQINAAIEKGAKWLKAQRKADGLFGGVIVNDREDYQIGLSALCGLALLASGESKKDAGMLKTLDACKAQDAIRAGSGVRTTYDTGVLLMFITEMFRPEMKDEKKERYATKPKKDPCNLPKDMASWVQDLAGWLVSVQLEEGWWRYPIAPPGDLSNTQYALLGLRAARDCGATVPASCFMRAIDGTLAAQEQDGPKLKRIIKGSGKPGETDYAVEGGDRARGWPYQHGAGGITGSMTTAAIGTLAISRDALLRPERFSAYSDELDRKVKRSVQDGFAWLDRNWSVEFNPPRGGPNWHYYYLYGLERACVYGDREHVGNHDWYAEGAMYLVGHQLPDGHWSSGATGVKEGGPSDLCDTAWALLFLKKATRPVIPVPAPVVTGG